MSDGFRQDNVNHAARALDATNQDTIFCPLEASGQGVAGEDEVSYFPLDDTKLNQNNSTPVEQMTEKRVQGVANTQKSRLRNGAGSCEGKYD